MGWGCAGSSSQRKTKYEMNTVNGKHGNAARNRLSDHLSIGSCAWWFQVSGISLTVLPAHRCAVWSCWRQCGSRLWQFVSANKDAVLLLCFATCSEAWKQTWKMWCVFSVETWTVKAEWRCARDVEISSCRLNPMLGHKKSHLMFSLFLTYLVTSIVAIYSLKCLELGVPAWCLGVLACAS